MTTHTQRTHSKTEYEICHLTFSSRSVLACRLTQHYCIPARARDRDDRYTVRGTVLSTNVPTLKRTTTARCRSTGRVTPVVRTASQALLELERALHLLFMPAHRGRTWRGSLRAAAKACEERSNGCLCQSAALCVCCGHALHVCCA